MNKFFGWYHLQSTINLVIYAFIIIVYCLLPDIDHPIGTMTWIFLGLGIAGVLIGLFIHQNQLIWYSAGLLAVTFVAAHWIGHRGPIHTVWFALIASVPLYLMYGLPEALLGAIAFYSHLLADGYIFKI